MPDIEGQKAEVTFNITIKRKDTGIEETYEMVGMSTVEQAIELGATLKEKQDGSHT